MNLVHFLGLFYLFSNVTEQICLIDHANCINMFINSCDRECVCVCGRERGFSDFGTTDARQDFRSFYISNIFDIVFYYEAYNFSIEYSRIIRFFNLV